MAVYAIGDVQGCLGPLETLLAHIGFRAGQDQLWFTGDLVNRGPQSLEVLRFVRQLGEVAVTVLGNHDLHLLAVASSHARPKRHDTLEAVLVAPDREALLEWLRSRPLLHHDAALGYTLVHAGLLPQWDLETAARLALEVETLLRSSDHTDFFAHMYGNLPDHWHEELRGHDRARVIVNAFTRLRYCDLEGAMDLRHKGTPGTQPVDLLPWFRVPGRRTREQRVVFGHWSTLGLYDGDGVLGLDSGCLWGGALSAARLDVDPPRFFRVPCPAAQDVRHHA
jgi:bis(5'-nucleosyl)-tetraphosphatase (symmetrical)